MWQLTPGRIIKKYKISLEPVIQSGPDIFLICMARKKKPLHLKKMKYRLFLALAVIAPATFFGIIINRIIELDKSLTLVNGTMKTFKSFSGGARSSRNNTFTLEEYPVEFKRSYKGLARINVKDRSDDLIGKRAVYESDHWRPEELKSKNERQVSFFTAATNWPPCGNSKESITYFDLKFKKENRSEVLHYLDLFSYISKNENGIDYFFLSFFTTMIFLGLSVPAFQNNKLVGTYFVTIVIVHLILFVF